MSFKKDKLSKVSSSSFVLFFDIKWLEIENSLSDGVLVGDIWLRASKSFFRFGVRVFVSSNHCMSLDKWYTFGFVFSSD